METIVDRDRELDLRTQERRSRQSQKAREDINSKFMNNSGSKINDDDSEEEE